MNLERENSNTKWYKNNELRIKQKDLGKVSEIWITLDRYNMCLTLLMFDFTERIKDDLLLDVSIQKDNGQRVFEINSSYASELINYILYFISEWGITSSSNTVSNSDFIPDEIFYL